MKIVVTGASGYVGRNLVPILKDQCDALVLVGREPGRLRQLYLDIPCCTAQDLPILAKNFDALIHLAALNNDVEADAETFHAVNVSLTLQIAEIASSAKIQRLYNVSSVHVLDGTNKTFYTKSKRAAITALAGVKDIEVVNILLPFVRGERWNGKLSFLNVLPSILAKPLEACLLTLKPSVTVDRLATYLIFTEKLENMVILSEGQSKNYIYHFIKRGLIFFLRFVSSPFFGGRC